jgi:uncharacterized protein with LGFP repeats
MRTVDPLGSRSGSTSLPVGLSRWRTPAHSLVAVTWRGDVVPTVEARLGQGDWQRVHQVPETEGGSGVQGTEPLWLGGASRLAVRISGAADQVRLVVITPGADPRRTPRRADARSAAAGSAKPPKRAPRPEIHTRKDWGANERWRNSRPKYNDKLKQVHLHHTANGNDYKRREVRGLLRSIYRYHTHNLGWSDIGYNVLVDRFGRAWVGRAGGVDKLVRGAHTLGFNHSSTGIAVIGNFETQAPRAEVVTMLVHLAAWKLDRYGRNPQGRTTVTSQGSDLFAKGERVRLPVIDGHRDTNQTACPGQLLYDLLPDIRQRAKARVDKYS